jgi:hypothetical protein
MVILNSSISTFLFKLTSPMPTYLWLRIFLTFIANGEGRVSWFMVQGTGGDHAVTSVTLVW